MEQSGWTALAYSLSVLVALAFASYAFLFGWLRQKRANKAVDTEEFVTARGTCSFWRIGWSFYAGAVGAWVITAPPLFASSLGIPGVIVYAITSGLPILLIAFLGGRITAALPHVFSLTDYTAWRYGPVAKSLVAAICLFNMSIALLAEYSAIGSIFADFVNGLDWPIILVIGVLTLAYTAYGGLIVSIATDQIQGIASIILATVLVIYVAVTYRCVCVFFVCVPVFGRARECRSPTHPTHKQKQLNVLLRNNENKIQKQNNQHPHPAAAARRPRVGQPVRLHFDLHLGPLPRHRHRL